MVQHVSLQLSSVTVVVSLLSSSEAGSSKGLSFLLPAGLGKLQLFRHKKHLTWEG